MKPIRSCIALVIIAVAFSACTKKDKPTPKTIRVSPAGGVDLNANAASRLVPTVASKRILTRTWVKTLNITAKLEQAFASNFIGGVCAQLVKHDNIDVVEVSSAAPNCAPDALNIVNDDQVYALDRSSVYLESGQSSVIRVGVLNSNETELEELCSGSFEGNCHFLSENTGEFAGIVVDR